MSLPLKPKRLVPGAIAHYAPIKNRNLIKWSEDFSNSVWTKGTGVTVESNVGIAPNGTLTADKVSYNGSGVMDGTKIYNAVIPTAIPSGIKYAVSIWIRSDIPLTMRLHPNIPGTVTINITTEWKRFSAIGTGNNVAYLIPNILSVVGDNNPFDIYVWGAQVELSPSATTYQRTTDLQTVWNQKQENMSVTNIVTNGNFASGTSGWNASGVTISANNNILTVLALSQNGNVNNPLQGGTVIGRKYYGRAKVKATSSLIGFRVGTSTPDYHSGNNQYEILSVIFTAINTNHSANIIDTRSSGWDTFYVQEVFSVDLTSLFGAGNEPQTTQQCDEMFSWFDGSIRMNLNRYNGMLGSTSAVDVNDPTYDGTGLSFGGDDYVNVGSNTALNIVNNDFTLLVICKPTTTNLESLIGKNTFALNGWGIYQNANKFNVLIRGASAGKFVSSNSNYILNNWYIIAGRRMSNVLSLFINGNKQTSEVTIEEIVESSSNNFIIGKPVNSSLYYFNGNICNVLIYNRALTDAEIAQNYYVFRQECARLGVILP